MRAILGSYDSELTSAEYSPQLTRRMREAEDMVQKVHSHSAEMEVRGHGRGAHVAGWPSPWWAFSLVGLGRAGGGWRSGPCFFSCRPAGVHRGGCPRAASSARGSMLILMMAPAASSAVRVSQVAPACRQMTHRQCPFDGLGPLMMPVKGALKVLPP